MDRQRQRTGSVHSGLITAYLPQSGGVLDGEIGGNNSLSNVLCFLSAGRNFHEKNKIGHQTKSICCSSTAPTVRSEASTMMQVGASSWEWHMREAAAKASLLRVKVESASDVQVK